MKTFIESKIPRPRFALRLHTHNIIFDRRKCIICILIFPS